MDKRVELPKFIFTSDGMSYEHEVPVYMAENGALVLHRSVYADVAESVYLFPEQVQALVNELAKLGIVAEVQA